MAGPGAGHPGPAAPLNHLGLGRSAAAPIRPQPPPATRVCVLGLADTVPGPVGSSDWDAPRLRPDPRTCIRATHLPLVSTPMPVPAAGACGERSVVRIADAVEPPGGDGRRGRTPCSWASSALPQPTATPRGRGPRTAAAPRGRWPEGRSSRRTGLSLNREPRPSPADGPFGPSGRAHPRARLASHAQRGSVARRRRPQERRCRPHGPPCPRCASSIPERHRHVHRLAGPGTRDDGGASAGRGRAWRAPPTLRSDRAG